MQKNLQINLMKTICRNIFLLVALLCFPLSSSGGDLHIFHLGHQDGLCGNFIRNISEDSHGFVWVVTGNGLNRFDGSGFQEFTKENSGLTSNELNCVIPDPSDPDILWIGTRHDGLCKYDYKTGGITRYDRELYTPDIPALAKSGDNKIWIAHYHFPPEKLDPATGMTTRLFKERPEDFQLPIWCVAEDSTRKLLYVGHENNGLTVVNLKTLKFKNYRHIPDNDRSLNGNTVYTILSDTSNQVWLGTENGISIFNPDTEDFITVTHNDGKDSLLPGAVKSIVKMRNGDIWIASAQGGISILENDNLKTDNFKFKNITTNTSINPERNLYSSSPVALFEDSYGNKWIGYYSDGIDVISYEPPFFQFASLFSINKGNHNYPAVWSATKDRNGDIWIGGEKEIAKTGNFLPERYPLPPSSTDSNSPVRALYADDYSGLYIGTSNSGGYKFDIRNKNYNRIKNIDREIRCFCEDKNGKILAGTHNGIYYIDENLNAKDAYGLNKNLPDKYITSLAIDKNGNLLVGSFGQGVTVIDMTGKIIAKINIYSGLPSNSINTIHQDTKGLIWIATRMGVARLSPSDYNELKILPMASRGASANIKAIEEGWDGRIWMSSEDGLSCYNPDTDSIMTYSNIYKASLTSFLEGSSCVDDNGTILFGSLNGLLFFYPYDTRELNFKKSKVFITGLYANDINGEDCNQEISIPVNSNRIELPYNLNTFRLNFNNPDITLSVNSEIRYNMKGVNEVWTVTGKNHEAVYRNLKPGKYEFQVSQRFFGGEWSAPRTLLTIDITPPIYLTWWAKSCYLIIASAILYLIIHFYKYKLNLEKNLEIEKQNSKNISLLNEERLAFYTNVTHELRTPLSLIIGPIEDLVNDPQLRNDQRKKLHTIRTSSMRLLNLINSILEFRKTETGHRKLKVTYGNLANYILEIGLRFKELNSNKDVNFILDVDDLKDRYMYYDPEMINSILSNLLGNAIKFTKEGSITLSMKRREDKGIGYVDISVTDTGEGIAADELPHIFKRYYQASHNKKVAGTGIGLSLTKSLVELHQGFINVSSEKGKGSTFTVTLILDNCYQEAIHNKAEEEHSNMDDDTPEFSTRENMDDKLSILIVEDDEDVRDYIANSFEDTYKIITARNGKEGLEAVRSALPDIVVSDIMMPEMDGLELCTEIKKDVTINHIPVILLTAKDSILDKEQGYDCGADSYITKPFSTKLLLSRINNILETRHRISLQYLSQPFTCETNGDGQYPQAQSESSGTTVNEPELTPLDREFIAKLRGLIEENIEIEELDMAFLTDKMCMSHSTLYRKVKSISGLTPNEFIRKIKLTKAIEILMSGKVAINEIPFMTGFNSMGYFRRVFKKEFGVSPVEYIQQHKSEYKNNPTT